MIDVYARVLPTEKMRMNMKTVVRFERVAHTLITCDLLWSGQPRNSAKLLEDFKAHTACILSPIFPPELKYVTRQED